MGFDPDDLGKRDPAFIRRWLPAFQWLSRHYFRLEARGLEHLPAGPAIVVGNHNGGIMGPDLMCTLPFLWKHLTPERPFYALAHDFAMVQVPPLGRLLQKWGAIRASRANARRVIEAGGVLLVYPGGDLEAYRSFKRRHQVDLGGRTGFIHVARERDIDIVPIVVRGAHQSALILSEGAGLARALKLQRWARVSRFPVALALPWGIAAGPWLPYLPLPFSLRLQVLPPVRVASDESALDASRRIQALMQEAMDQLA